MHAITYDVVIVGGGLGGLASGLQLAQSGVKVCLLEKKKYPFHRVCGEYISNETLPFLQKLEAYPDQFHPVSLRRFQLTSVGGMEAKVTLDLGGFGISRYAFDSFLAERAVAAGMELREQTRVEDVQFLDHEQLFEIKVRQKPSLFARVVLGAYGKRERLDKVMKRSFIDRRSPFIGVKYHMEYPYPEDLIALHNFPGGYCGMSQVEEGRLNVCYLGSRKRLRKWGSIPEMEKQDLWKNPFLKQVLREGKRLIDPPLVINEISFARKEPVLAHVLMVGDSAGLITPLCGNGMAMALHGAALAADEVMGFLSGDQSRKDMEKNYARRWRQTFGFRLWVGRATQHLFGNRFTSALGTGLLRYAPIIGKQIVRATHGPPFSVYYPLP